MRPRRAFGRRRTGSTATGRNPHQRPQGFGQADSRTRTPQPGTCRGHPHLNQGGVISMCRCTCVKVSVQMPEELVAAVRTMAGASGFSEYVTEAVDRRHRHDLLGELIAELEAEYGPLDEAQVLRAARMW